MTEAPTVSATAVKTTPVALLETEQRHAHVARRLLERSGIVWTADQVAALEKKMKMVRGMVNEQKTPAPILPTKIGDERNGQNHFYRVLIAGRPHTFVWSQVAKGILTYRGPGELKEPTPETAKAS